MTLVLMCAVTALKAQERPVPFSEADKAMAIVEKQKTDRDSMIISYDRIWSVDFTFGQRYISSEGRSDIPDTITTVDFADRKSFYGLGASYSPSNRWTTGIRISATFIPRNQVISNITIGSNGISGEGQGNGGLILDLTGYAKYTVINWGTNRIHAGVELGAINLIARGGEVSFSAFSGRNENIRTRRARLFSAQLLTGFTHRFSPVLMSDISLGYTHTSETESIGGIIAARGFTSSISLKFILNNDPR